MVVGCLGSKLIAPLTLKAGGLSTFAVLNFCGNFLFGTVFDFLIHTIHSSGFAQH
jgi:hypothetical protein